MNNKLETPKSRLDWRTTALTTFKVQETFPQISNLFGQADTKTANRSEFGETLEPILINSKPDSCSAKYYSKELTFLGSLQTCSF